ncbi:MAG: tyrosine-protein phosphatase [Euryarchaeota archaeon]|nr:tyrosine-protein phosphatase [Euryarchaeota archaeon]
MRRRIHFDDDTTSSGALTEADIDELESEGYRAIVDLRTEDEELAEGRLDPLQEARLSRRRGLDHIHLPVHRAHPKMEKVQTFLKILQELPRPVLVHCSGGKRSGAFLLIERAVREGWSGRDALAEGRRVGYDPDDKDLEQAVANYIDTFGLIAAHADEY